MKLILIIVAVLSSVSMVAQSKSFPKEWEGNWKGELQWFKTGKSNLRK
jgi:hypothetical protein